MITITQYDEVYKKKVFDFIYRTMSEELIVDKETFNKITEDLRNIEKEYISKNGEVWIAINEELDEIIGTIAIREIKEDIAELKRFYVKKEYRSKKIGYKLYSTLTQHAIDKGFSIMYLVSGKELKKAHRFYEKNDWKIVDAINENIDIYVRDNAHLYKKVI